MESLISLAGEVDIIMIEKKCSKCQVNKPLSEFGRCAKSPDGLNSWCKECCAAQWKSYRESHREERRLSGKNYREKNRARVIIETPMEKECTKCHKLKPSKDFAPDKSRTDGIRPSCKLCDSIRWESYSESHSSAIKKSNQSLRDRYKIKNDTDGCFPEKECSSCHIVKPCDQFWPDHNNKSGLRSRCIECSKKTYLARGKRLAMIDLLGGKCAICGSTDKLEIDHIIPLNLGGSHDTSNLQVLCGKHNRKKGNKPPAVYLSRVVHEVNA